MAQLSATEFQARFEASVQAFNARDLGAYYGIFAPGVVFHGAGQSLQGVEALRNHYGAALTAFPDLAIRVERLVVDAGGMVAASENVEVGTHTGILVTPQGVMPATNRRLEMRASAFYVLNEAGLVGEMHEYVDRMQFLEQLSGFPPRPSYMAKMAIARFKHRRAAR